MHNAHAPQSPSLTSDESPAQPAPDGVSARGARAGAARRSLFDDHLRFDNVLAPQACGPREQFEAFARSVRDTFAQRWIDTEAAYARANPKRIYYLSMEYLLGRALSNNLSNLLIGDRARSVAEDKGLNWAELLEQESEAGLGNGGLGRLAACFLDSMATMQLPAMGYGLRYEYGMFRQILKNGYQQEQPDNWLHRQDPWEVQRPNERVEVRLNSSFEVRGGTLRAVVGKPSVLVGIPYDRPIVGYGGRTVNSLRLWAATASDYFNLDAFNHGEFVDAVAESLEAATLTRVLYPDDSTSFGQGLRFVQEYFLVACSLADILRRFKASHSAWAELPEKVAIQLNDTHPALAVPELMRLLLDDARLGWDAAWHLTQQTLAYTNHTLLPEALEKWPVAWFEALLPRQLEIVYEINRRLLGYVRTRYARDDERARRTSLIEEGPVKHVRMAHLAIVGAHSTNGVSTIHSRLLRTTVARELAELFPKRFNNKTNGVSPRRWLLLANPPLSRLITEAIGDDWQTDLSELNRLKRLADDEAFRDCFRAAKRESKAGCVAWLDETLARNIDPDSLFDCQIKRVHEYKRQLLNALRIVILYQRLRERPHQDVTPRTFIFAGKAAAGYRMAKLVIKLIHNIAAALDADPLARGRLTVLFLPQYDVSLAQRLIPASDVSNQISTAGYEASGTSNMKFMMNGAVTLGTRDGATIEIADAVGEGNLFLFGLTAQQVLESRPWYSPLWHYENEPETRAALDLIRSGFFDRSDRGVFAPLLDLLTTHGDYYMHLADLRSYMEADGRLTACHADSEKWSRVGILNVAASGYFSSDRTIAEYASEIWHASPCPVP